MEQSQWEVIILKPTSLFLSFLAAQNPDLDLPNFSLLQTDNTAYVIHKQFNEEAMVDEIERHYPLMFKHEISRWLGEDAVKEFEASFLDFLCCFKFETHSQIVLMEPDITDGGQLLCIKPRSVLLKWVKSVVEEEELSDILDRVSISNLVENSTVVVKNFKTLEEIKPFIEQHYKPIFKAEMSRMCEQQSQWPEINDFKSFSRYFTIHIHTHLIHLH